MAKITKPCNWCKKEHIALLSEIGRGGGKFCSPFCYRKNRSFVASQRVKPCKQCGKNFHYFPFQEKKGIAFLCSKECRIKWSSNILRGRPFVMSDSHKKSHKEAMARRRGKPSPIRGIPRPHMRGENNPRWKGGIYDTLRQKVMKSIEYKNWRRAVFERDNFICQDCGQKGVWLEANHIFPYKDFPELRFEISNGETLCKPCHLQWARLVRSVEILPFGGGN